MNDHPVVQAWAEAVVLLLCSGGGSAAPVACGMGDGQGCGPCAELRRPSATTERCGALCVTGRSGYHLLSTNGILVTLARGYTTDTISSVDGEQVRAWRRSHRLSQTALAQLLGTTKQAIYYWESGRRQPPAMLELALAELDRRLAGEQHE